MKKQLRNIIISFCVVVLLVAGIIVGNKVIKKTTTSSSSGSESSSSLTISVFKTTSADITAVHVKNSNGEYTIHQADSKFTLDGIKTSILSQDSLSSAVTAAADIEATKLIEKGSTSLDKYGLDNAEEYIGITAGGKTVTINVGDETPLKDGRYINVKGSSDVYKIDTTVISSFEDTAQEYVNLSICGIDSTALTNITDLEFGGSSRAKPIVLVEDTSAASSSSAASTTSSDSTTPTYTMQSPSDYPVDSDKTTSVLTTLESLSASGVISLDVSDANLQKYGLKDPQYTFSATNKGSKMTLDFGTPYDDGGTTYLPLVLEGTPVIYKISSSSVTFYNYQLTDICSSLLFLKNIDTVKSVTVTKGSESYAVNMTGTGDNLAGTCGSTKLLADNIRKFYEAFIGISFEGAAEKPANGSIYAKVVVTYRDTSKAATTIEFISIDSRRSFWSIDGKGDFYVLNSSIDNLLAKTKELAAGKTLSD